MLDSNRIKERLALDSAGIIRHCNICGKRATFVGLNSLEKWIMECPEGHRFSAQPGRLETWHGQKRELINFYIERKVWAREIVREQDLKPGDQVTAEFEGQKMIIRIGPRRGVNISQI
jgi:hypothetical protein